MFLDQHCLLWQFDLSFVSLVVLRSADFFCPSTLLTTVKLKQWTIPGSADCQSSYQTLPILDKRLWLAHPVPGRVEICLNGRGTDTSARANKTWARQIRLVPRLKAFGPKANMLGMLGSGQTYTSNRTQEILRWFLTLIEQLNKATFKYFRQCLLLNRL